MAQKPISTTYSQKIKEVSKDQKLTSGIYVNSGQITQSDWDTQTFNELMIDLVKMRDEDAIVASSIDLFFYAILNSNIKIESRGLGEDKPSDIAEESRAYIAWQFDNLFPSPIEYLRHLILAYPYGFAMFEKIWDKGVEYNGHPTNIIQSLLPIQPDSVFRFNYDEKMYFSDIEQKTRRPNRGYTINKILADDLFWFSPFSEYGNIQGRPLLRPARMAWKTKRSIIQSHVRAAIRGSGVPNVKFTPTGNPEVDTQIRAILQEIGRTIGNSEKSFVITQPGVVDVEFMELKHQEKNLEIIDLCNKEIWYNTLSYFITSGIGGNGSRAATEEHKSPYIEVLNTFIKLIEWSQDTLINEMMAESYLFGKLTIEEYPDFKLERFLDKDLTTITTNIATMFTMPGMKLTLGDKKYVRDLLGLPEVSEEELKDQIVLPVLPELPAPPAEPIVVENEAKQNLVLKIVQAEGMRELKIKEVRHNSHFNLDSASEAIGTANEEAIKTLDEVYNKLVADMAKQLAENPNKKPSLRFKKEMMDKMSNVFNKVFQKGFKDSQTEVKEVVTDVKEVKQLASKIPIKSTGVLPKLVGMIETLYSALENGISNDLLNVNPKIIENAGGMEQYIKNNFADSQKRIRSNLIAITEGGYTEGRGEATLGYENEGYEFTKKYLTTLETNVCEKCRPLHNGEFTKQEAESVGLNWDSSSSVNPECLGGINCKCQWETVEGTLVKGRRK